MTEERPKSWDADLDAGEMGCGDLVLSLRKTLLGLEPGTVLRLRAADSGAAEDIPSWCRLTGNILLFAEPPYFFIQRNKEK